LTFVGREQCWKKQQTCSFSWRVVLYDIEEDALFVCDGIGQMCKVAKIKSHFINLSGSEEFTEQLKKTK